MNLFLTCVHYHTIRKNKTQDITVSLCHIHVLLRYKYLQIDLFATYLKGPSRQDTRESIDRIICVSVYMRKNETAHTILSFNSIDSSILCLEELFITFF